MCECQSGLAAGSSANNASAARSARAAFLGVAAVVALNVGGCGGPAKERLARDTVARWVTQCEMEASRVAVDVNSLDADQEPSYIVTCMHANGYDFHRDLPGCTNAIMPQAATACYLPTSKLNP